jgi:hypothetical protein
MKEVKGSLKMLGSADIQTTIEPGVSVYTYSVIEIGDAILGGIQVRGGLNNFLRRGLQQDGTVTLYLIRARLVGVQLPDGKLYYQKANRVLVSFFLIFSIALIPFLGLGLLMLPSSVSEFRSYRLGRRLGKQGGIGV